MYGFPAVFPMTRCRSGHLITMMRQPEQRILSAYHDARFDHGASRYPNVCHARDECVIGLITGVFHCHGCAPK